MGVSLYGRRDGGVTVRKERWGCHCEEGETGDVTVRKQTWR